MHVFGPVMSRRLGLSLGIDPVSSKSCNWNCIYCQLGRTFPRVGERRRFCNPAMMLQEVAEHLAKPREKAIDWITLVGSGETLLSADIGMLIRQIKAMTTTPVAVITNGSLLGAPAVIEELSSADAVLPSLDAGSKELYWRINRPLPQFTFDKHIDGLIEFRKAYKGKLWIEVMLVKGMNDDEESINDISDRLRQICPDEVHLLTPTRPPAEAWVSPAGNDALLLASSIIGKDFRVIVPQEPVQSLRAFADTLQESLESIVKRHPLREEVLLQMLEQYGHEEAKRMLDEILQGGVVSVVERMGTRFLVDNTCRYRI